MYIKQLHKCGIYTEEERYSVSNRVLDTSKKARVPRDQTKQTSKEQEESNIKRAEKWLRRLANTNFIHNKDLFVTLTTKKKLGLKEVKRITKNFIERLAYYFKKNKLGKLKYIYCYGEHKKEGIHTHMVVSGVNIDKLIEVWEKDQNAGRIHISKLHFSNRDGIGGLMAYFIRNFRELVEKARKRGEKVDVFNMRKYTPSQKLKQPRSSKPIYITRKQMVEEPKARKGFMNWCDGIKETEYGRYQLIHIIRVANMRS